MGRDTATVAAELHEVIAMIAARTSADAREILAGTAHKMADELADAIPGPTPRLVALHPALTSVLERLETAAASGTGYLADEARSILADFGYDEGNPDD